MFIIVTTLIFSLILAFILTYLGIKYKYGFTDVLIAIGVLVLSTAIYYNVFCWGAYRYQVPAQMSISYNVKLIIPDKKHNKELHVVTELGDEFNVATPISSVIKERTPYKLVVQHSYWTTKQLLMFGASHLDDHKIEKDKTYLIQ